MTGGWDEHDRVWADTQKVFDTVLCVPVSEVTGGEDGIFVTVGDTRIRVSPCPDGSPVCYRGVDGDVRDVTDVDVPRVLAGLVGAVCVEFSVSGPDRPVPNVPRFDFLCPDGSLIGVRLDDETFRELLTSIP